MPAVLTRLREFIALVAEPSMAIDVDGRIVAWNRSAERTLGYSEADVLGQHCWKLLRGCDQFGNAYCRPGCPLRIAHCEGRPVQPFALAFRRKDGAYADVRCGSLAIRGEGGGPLYQLHHMTEAPTAAHPTPPRMQDEGTEAGVDSLSKRELEVLRLLADAVPVGAIARRLFIAPATARRHLQAIFRKIGVHSRLEAVVRARALGLLAIPR
jgi:PAS domain S-box-containing protein